jgi:hypothetical protein
MRWVAQNIGWRDISSIKLSQKVQQIASKFLLTDSFFELQNRIYETQVPKTAPSMEREHLK